MKIIRMPEPARQWFAEDPERLYLITVPLMVWCGLQFARSVQLHTRVGMLAAEVRSDAARAASEALGG